MCSVGKRNQASTVVAVEADRALQRSKRNCLDEVPVVNPAEGCLFGCLFCGTKLKTGQVRIKSNLPALLEKELQKREQKGNLPQAVVFNTATDSFQPIEELLSVTHDCMQIVLKKEMELHFITRGNVPDSFSRLFKRHGDKIHAQVSFLTMDDNLSLLYEPSAAGPQARLETVRNLKAWGVNVRGRIDPLIPFLTDTVGHMEELLRYLSSAGITHCLAAYLVLRPHILEKFEKALPDSHFHLIKGSFKGQAWRKVGINQMTKLLPERTRSKGYERLLNIARRLDVKVGVCACDDPTHGSSCFSRSYVDSEQHSVPNGQLNLFMG